MSGSPKYSSYSISDEAARRVREENRRREQERAAQRAAEAERLRKERLRKKQAAFNTLLAAGKKDLAEFAATPAGRHVTDVLRQLQARLAQFEQKPPLNEDDIARAERELNRVGRDLKQAMAQGEAIEEGQNLKEEAATVLKWERLAAVDRQDSRRFDLAGLERFEAALEKVKKMLAGRQLAAARQAMTAVGTLFEQHRAEVEERRSAWLAKKQAAETALARLHEHIAGLQADADVQQWQAQAIAEIASRVGEMSEIIKNGQFDHAVRQVEKLLAEADRVLKAAEERQQVQGRQDFVADRAIAALQDCGFTLDPSDQSPQSVGTNILIHVRDAQGRGLTVSVPQEGAIEWDPYGFPRQVVAGSQGQAAATCDEAVNEIEEVQARLRSHGVETCDLNWIGKDPNLQINKAKGRSRPMTHHAQRTRQARR